MEYYEDPQYEPVARKLATPGAFTHYYGDVVRKLFLVVGLCMLVALPFFNQFLPVSAFVSLLAVLVVGIVAGLTNPMQRWVMVFDVIVSLIGLVSFEYHAVSRFDAIPYLLFGLDQLLAVIFFFSLYLSIKTLRGVFVSDYTIRQRRQEAREKEQASHYGR